MRRLYIAPHDVWYAHVWPDNHFHPKIGSSFVHLLTYTDPSHAELIHTDNAAWEALPEVIAWRAAGAHILISTDVSHSEYAEDVWHAHPEVVILPHPQLEGTDQLSKHKDSKTKKLKQKHLDALSTIGITDKHTVWDVSDRAKAILPTCKLRAIL